MLLGIEFVLALAAIAGGISMFVVGVRRRPAAGARLNSDTDTAGIMAANLYSLAVIALLFFGTAFLIDVFL